MLYQKLINKDRWFIIELLVDLIEPVNHNYVEEEYIILLNTLVIKLGSLDSLSIASNVKLVLYSLFILISFIIGWKSTIMWR